MQVGEPQIRMTNHFAAVEFLFAEQNAEQRAFAGAIAAHDFHDFAVDRFIVSSFQ
jgi:hypothetical protein